MTLNFRELPLEGENGLVDFFKRVPDPRSQFGKRHSLHGMLGLTYCAVLCGVQTFSGIDIWAKGLSKEDHRAKSSRRKNQRDPSGKTNAIGVRKYRRCDHYRRCYSYAG